MKTGKVSAKLRDLVPVSFIEHGQEVFRSPNIEIPDSLKELEMQSCEFVETPEGKIIFEIRYANGILPKAFPGPRVRKTRANDSVLFAAMLAKETAKISR